MSKIRWSCCEIGVHGVVMISAELDMSGPDQPEALFGYRRAIHPFQVDEQPESLAWTIREMTEVMERAQCPLMQIDPETGAISIVRTLPESRACAFGDRHEQARA